MVSSRTSSRRVLKADSFGRSLLEERVSEQVIDTAGLMSGVEASRLLVEFALEFRVNLSVSEIGVLSVGVRVALVGVCSLLF